MPENNSTKKPFQKKQYRPWDILENTETKIVTQKEPIGNQLVTNTESISNHNKEPIGNQLVTIKEVPANKSEPISNPNSNHNKEPIGNQLVTNEAPLNIVQRLSGLQRKILFYVVENCSTRGELTSGPITNETLRLLCNTNADTIKTAIQRLIKKCIIKRNEGKRGKGGFATFTIPISIRNAALEELRQHAISNQLVTAISNQLVTNRLPNKEPTPSSSSSNNNINNIKTTTTDDWPDFDIEPLTSIGFTKTHVQQIAQQGRVPKEVVQDSVYMFAFDLEHNKKAASIKGSPLNFFMGILRKGDPYNPPDNYESPSDRARRLYKEDLQRREKIRLAEEKQIIDLSFNEWLAEKTEEYKYSLLSDAARATKANFQKMLEWRDFYVKEIWPQQLKEIMKK